ncbi:MAG: TauD/TfdA family dioxygenase [Alphaproteobacteria bacterium]|nr:TauD/TfdA family dioxygenase [Alphaproteobacteria bacterium]
MMAGASLAIAPLGPVMAAGVRGLDLSIPLDDATFAAVCRALHDHQVLVFRDQDFDETAHVAFSRRFGVLQAHVLNQYQHRANPEILFLTNVLPDGTLRGEHPDPGSMIWHTDASWSARRALATTLLAVTLPKAGGDTLFANMYAAHDGLAPALRARLAGLRAVHSLDHSRRLSGAREQMTEAQKRAAPPVEHEILRTHPDTGRTAIYLGEHASHIAGMAEDEGRALVQRVNAHATQPAYRYIHRWSPGDFVMWDNRCVLHSATDFDWRNDRRTMRRTTILGERIGEA